MRACLILLTLIPLLLSSAAADEATYDRHIKPLLKHRCGSCHGALRQNGGLRLDTAAFILRGGDSGAGLVPGQLEQSLLWKRITAEDAAERMPPEADSLTAEELAIIREWITAGAKAPDDEKPERDPHDHWAFRAPVRPPVPAAAAEWNANPIDAFIAARHQQSGLTAQPKADKAVLLRRAYFDLIGLPPTPQQLEAFLKDDSADAWPKVVDQLLDSPHYGERWGRHWMDVWRYSDWYGYQAELRNSARHLWRWRDWIIESLNQDRPYDRMIQEMLAADELAPGDEHALRATGFLARHYYKFNRNTWLETTIEHTSKAFLGITMNCARCHDHMYDPISQREYYQFRAIFEPYQVRTDRVPGEADITKNGLSRAFDQDLTTSTYLFKRGNDAQPVKDDPLTAALPKLFADSGFAPALVDLPSAVWYPGLQPFLQDEMKAAAEATFRTRQQELKKAQDEHAKAAALIAELSGKPREPEPSPKSQPSPAERLVDENFDTRRDDIWEIGSGDWHFENGILIQKQTGAERRAITLKTAAPRDFSTTMTVKILDGRQWKSVGLDFDAQPDGTHQTVYISAYAGGPKVQYSHANKGQTIYPPDGAKPLPIETGRIHVLRIDARDRLINIHVDGQFALAYRLPMERRAGRMALWAFDAAAEFHAFQLEELAPSTALVEPVGSAPPAAPVIASLDDAIKAGEVADRRRRYAEQALKTSETTLESLAARIAADRAKYAQPPAEDATDRAASAYRSERRLAFAEATLAVLSAKVEEAEALALPAENSMKTAKLDAARKKIADLVTKQNEAAKRLDETGNTWSPLTPMYPVQSTGRRLALARWIAGRTNPLTARVAVNQIWMRHFGEPLVSTVFDFGMNGQPPSHPELLDWLAVEFMESGWSIKHLHRLMLTSRTWQLDSSDRGADAAMKLDPDNRLLWRAHTRRLESEIVRDALLAVSGRLDRTPGGPELEAAQGQTSHRRSLYYRHAPEKFMEFLAQFDSASTDECYRRNETIVPQQALALANSPLCIEQSRVLARRLEKDHPDTIGNDDRFIEQLFVETLNRRPATEESAACREFLSAQTARLASPSTLTALTAGPKVPLAPSGTPHQRARENLAHVLLNHNDFVTVR